MITGFSMGQMPHYAHMNYKLDGKLPLHVIEEIKAKAPADMIKNHRVSGTVANTMQISEPAFGNSIYASASRQQLKNRRVSEPKVSYLYAYVDYYRQLNAETMAFTINSHSPFLNECKIQDSMDSLAYMADNTNLISIELENETYYASQILGIRGTPNPLVALLFTNGKSLFDKKAVEKELRKRCNAFLDHLEKIVNELRKRGYNQPVGLSTHITSNITSRIWTEEVCKRQFWNFLTPHLYCHGYDLNDIENEFKSHLDHLPKNAEIRITEWNSSSDKVSKLETQAELIAFANRFHNVARRRKNVKATYMHTLWSSNEAFYSFIRSK